MAASIQVHRGGKSNGGPVVCAAHDEGQRSGLPTNAYLTSEPEMVPCVCQPQYWLQKPLDAVTSAEVRTK